MTESSYSSLLARCRDFFIEQGLAPDVADHILSFQLPTLELCTRIVDQEPLPFGHTRIGGAPDLPSGYEWPVHGEEPMFFLAQLDLDSLSHPASEEGFLPTKGVLSFFFTSSFDDIHKPGAGKVLFFDDPAQLVHRPELPERNYGNFRPCLAEALPRITLPDWCSPVAPLMNLGDEDGDALSNALYFAKDLVAEGYGGGHRLLGYACNGQSDATFWAAKAGLGEGEDRSDEVVMAKARDWCLLFQCREDEFAGMEWVDSGSVCFVIRKEDLRAGRFDRVFTDLQFD